MIEFSTLQLAGGILILLGSGILTGAIIGYFAAASEQNGEIK